MLWRLKVGAKVESSPVAIGRARSTSARRTDGCSRVYVRPAASSGPTTRAAGSTRARRSRATGSSSRPTPARSSASTASNGHKIWNTYVEPRLRPVRELLREPVDRRAAALHDLARREGRTPSRRANGHVIWTHQLNTTGYSTPAIAHGRVFVGGFDGACTRYRASTRSQIWRRVRRRPDPRRLVVGRQARLHRRTSSGTTYAAASRRRQDRLAGRRSASTQPGIAPTGTTTSR